MNKNKRINYIWIILIVAIMVIIGFCIIFSLIKHKNNSKNIDYNNEEINARMQDLVETNFLISYLLIGDIQVSENSVTIDDKVYYAVDDEILKNIKNLSDIQELLNNNYMQSTLGVFMRYFSSEEFNNYASFDDHLYVIKTNNVCKNFPSLNKNYRLEKIENNILYLNGNVYGIYVTKENDKWLLNSYDFRCQDSALDN